MKTICHVVKSGGFQIFVRWIAQFFCCNEGAVSVVLCKNIFVHDLLGSQHLFEILQTSLTFKNCENVVKSGCLGKLLRSRAPIFFSKMKEVYEVSCVNILTFC